MLKKGFEQKISVNKWPLWISCLLALLFIVLIFSPGNLDPGNTGWVTGGGGDNLQHYLGWRFFRSADWNRFLLCMQNLNYPVGTSVIVTDSNPLFCVIFKAFRDLLPETFQFNGIWIVCSYLLTAYFAALITGRLTKDPWLTVCGSLFAVLNPVILQRALIHDTLAAHWLILAAVWLALNEDSARNWAGWFVLTELTLLIHIYFIPMIGFILLLQVIRMVSLRRPFLRIIVPLISFGIALAAGYFVFGYVYITGQSGSYGELSMNLNAFFNPDSVPSLLSSRPINPLQYEGFNYFGLGMIALLILSIAAGGRNMISTILPYILPVLLLILAAASNEGYFDRTLVYSIPLPEKVHSLLSVFRSSGRLVWPVYYLSLLVCLYTLSKSGKDQKVLRALAAVFLLLQCFDLKDFYLECAERFRSPSNFPAEISQEVSESIPSGTKHLYCSDGDPKTADAFALFAADCHMTFNKSANARGMKHIYGGDLLEMERLSCEQIREDSVYIYLSADLVPGALRQCENLKATEINGWQILTRN